MNPPSLFATHGQTPFGNERIHGRSPAHRPARGPRLQNVGRQERKLSVLAGAGLIALGLVGPRLCRLPAAVSGAGLMYRGLTGHCHLYAALGIDSTRADPTGVPAQQGFRYEQSIAIQKPAAELYRAWRNLEGLPQIMRHLERVTALNDRQSEWIARGPFDVRLRWTAEIFEDRPNELIAWRSLPGGDVETAGSIHFRPLEPGHGTVLQLSLKYNPPGGKFTAGLAWLLGQGAEARIDEDLHRFKSRMETGDALT